MARPDAATPMTTDKTLFFCVGAQKSGTTWLHDQLSARPDFHTPMKEIHYFDMISIDTAHEGHLLAERDMFFQRRLAVLNWAVTAMASGDVKQRRAGTTQLFNTASVLEMCLDDPREDSKYLHFMIRNAGSKPVVGDVTPAYAILSRMVFARMAALSKQVRFLFLLRDPIDRLWSQVRMRMNRTVWANEAAFEKACVEDLEKTLGEGPLTGPHRSNYKLSLQELEAAVPKENLMVMFYETMFSHASMERLCRFIGIAPFVAKTDRKVLSGRSLPMPEGLLEPTYRWLADQYDDVAHRFGEALPERWRQRMTMGVS